MAALYARDIEGRVLRTLLNPKTPPGPVNSILSLDSTYFHWDPFKALFNRVKFMKNKRGYVMTCDEALADPSLENDHGDPAGSILEQCKPARSKKELNSLIRSLREYVLKRTVYTTAMSLLDDIEDDKYNSERATAFLTQNANECIRLQSADDSPAFIPKAGDDNTLDYFRNMLKNKPFSYYKTGISAYDSRNNGLPRSGVVVLASTSGGGKSLMLNYLGRNMSILNHDYRACFITMEMDKDEVYSRYLAAMTKTNIGDISRGGIRKSKRKEIIKTLKTQLTTQRENGSSFYYEPVSNLTIDECLTRAHANGANNVIGIDYIGLLRFSDNEQKWQALANAAEACKRFSREHNCLVIVLGQLDQGTGMLRSAKDIKNPSDVMWKWVYDETAKAEQKVKIIVDKARGGQTFEFDLNTEYHYMSFSDATSSSLYAADDNEAIDLSTSLGDDEDDDDDLLSEGY